MTGQRKNGRENQLDSDIGLILYGKKEERNQLGKTFLICLGLKANEEVPKYRSLNKHIMK